MMIKVTIYSDESLLYARNHYKHLTCIKTLNLLNCTIMEVLLSHFTEEETETERGSNVPEVRQEGIHLSQKIILTKPMTQTSEKFR